MPGALVKDFNTEAKDKTLLSAGVLNFGCILDIGNISENMETANAWVPPPRVYSVISLRWNLGIWTFKSFLGGSNVQLKLRTTVVGVISAEK